MATESVVLSFMNTRLHPPAALQPSSAPTLPRANLPLAMFLCRSYLRPSLWRDSLIATMHTQQRSRMSRDEKVKAYFLQAASSERDDVLLAACQAYFEAGGKVW